MTISNCHFFSAIAIVICISTTLAAYANPEDKECTGPYKGKELSQQDIDAVIHAQYLYHEESVQNSRARRHYERLHRKWIERITNAKHVIPTNKEPVQANLCGAHLTNADLQDVDLSWANLQMSNLSNVNLKGTNLTKTNLKNAYMYMPNLQDSNLSNANLQRSHLAMANLQGAHLNHAYLQGAHLAIANFQGAVLEYANLKNANLGGANLQNTNLKNSELQSADLKFSKLQGANLNDANLQGASLLHAKLQGAWLNRANLQGVNLTDADLTNAIFNQANLTNVLFEPKEGTLSIIQSIALAKGLSALSYKDNVQELVRLQKGFREAGFREQERMITFAIKHNEALHAWNRDYLGKVEAGFGFVFFEWTTDWGMNPGKSLRILLAMIFLFFFFYLVALQAPEENAGIWRYRVPERPVDHDKPEKSLIPFEGFWKSIPIALYFSTLSAFYFGWRDINVGKWIVRLQFTEYVFRPTGWVRTVAGIQSIISLYLLAIWFLTYFGRPFE